MKKLNTMKSYLTDYLSPTALKAIAVDAIRTLRPRLHEFDSIVVTGVSGMLVGSMISTMLSTEEKEIPLLVVRKDKDGAHSRQMVECYYAPSEWGRILIIDDLIDTGSTMERIINTLLNWTRQKYDDTFMPNVVGYYTYINQDRPYIDDLYWDELTTQYNLQDFNI